MNRRDAIEELRQELQKLTLASTNICLAIESLERNPNLDIPPIVDNQPATDREGRVINNGDKVVFLTKGKFRSTEGIVSRFSKNKERVFAVDIDGEEIPRAPRNVRIIDNTL